MEVSLQKFNLPFFLWYILPGLNLIGLNFFIPVLLIEPGFAKEVTSIGSVFSLVVAALIAGFILDSLKLYQVSRRYRDEKREFFENLSNELGLGGAEMARTYFEVLRIDLQAASSVNQAIASEHSRWVMINYASKSFYFLAVEWSAAVVWLHFSAPSSIWQEYWHEMHFWVVLSVMAAGSFVFVMGGLRLGSISGKIRRLCNSKYLLFAKMNSKQLMSSFEIQS